VKATVLIHTADTTRATTAIRTRHRIIRGRLIVAQKRLPTLLLGRAAGEAPLVNARLDIRQIVRVREVGPHRRRRRCGRVGHVVAISGRVLGRARVSRGQ